LTAYRGSGKVIRLTARRLIAAAAVAAIVASAPYLVHDYLAIAREPSAPAPVARSAMPAPPVRIVLGSPGRDGPTRAATRLISVPIERTDVAPPQPHRGLVDNDAPDNLRIPAVHVLYDPEESSHWW
jgi:hypothetical protein